MQLAANLGVRQDPVFVAGFPRSGTTLMQSLLAAQSGMVSFPETQFFLLVPSAPEQQSVAESVLDQLLVGFSKHIQISAFAASRLRELCRNGELSAKGLFEQIVCDQIVQRLGGDGLRRRWVEKSPWHGFHMDRIVAYYPQAKFIFMLRNPLHCFASRRGINSSNTSGWGEGWRPVESYAEEWVAIMRAMERFKARYPDHIMLVTLESLADQPQETMRQVCDFCSIDFDPGSIENHRASAESLIGTGQQWKRDVAAMPISAAIASREHGPGLTAYEQFRVACMIGRVMADYGYHAKAEMPSSLGPEEIDIVMKATDFYRAELRSHSLG